MRGIELWGYPGSGKSSVAERLRAQGLPVILPRSLKDCSAAAPLAIVRRAAELRFLVAQLPGRDASARRRLSLLWLRHSCTLAALNAPALFEEGFVHGLWRSLYYDPEAASKRWWQGFASELEGTVLLLRVTPETALARIGQKPLVRGVNLELAGASLDGEAWERARRAHEVLLERLRGAPDVELVEIDAERSSVQSLADEVAQRFGRAAAA